MAIVHQSEMVLEVDGDDPAAIQRDLDAAVQIARGIAMLYGRGGIMVTQHDYWSFTVAVSQDVPYGQTQETRRWRSLY